MVLGGCELKLNCALLEPWESLYTNISPDLRPSQSGHCWLCRVFSLDITMHRDCWGKSTLSLYLFKNTKTNIFISGERQDPDIEIIPKYPEHNETCVAWPVCPREVLATTTTTSTLHMLSTVFVPGWGLYSLYRNVMVLSWCPGHSLSCALWLDLAITSLKFADLPGWDVAIMNIHTIRMGSVSHFLPSPG